MVRLNKSFVFTKQLLPIFCRVASCYVSRPGGHRRLATTQKLFCRPITWRRHRAGFPHSRAGLFAFAQYCENIFGFLQDESAEMAIRAELREKDPHSLVLSCALEGSDN
jgi:hypothetical protein